MTAAFALSGRNAMFRSLLWLAMSAMWLLGAVVKVHRLKSVGGSVSPFRYGFAIFWALVFAFWIVMALRDWKQKRLEAVRKVS